MDILIVIHQPAQLSASMLTMPIALSHLHRFVGCHAWQHVMLKRTPGNVS